MSTSYEQAEAAIDRLDAYVRGELSDRKIAGDLATLERALASGVRENVGRFKEAFRRKRDWLPGMTRKDMLMRAVMGMRMGVSIFRNAGRTEV